MASNKSAFLEAIVLDFLYGLGDFAATFDSLADVSGETDIEFAIFKGDPEGAGVEVAGGGYARVPVSFGSGEWTRTLSTVVNDNDIDFGIASADWAASPNPATHIAAFVGTDMIYSQAMTAPRFILNGDPFKIAAGGWQHLED